MRRDQSSKIVLTLTKRKGKKVTNTFIKGKRYTPKQLYKLITESTFSNLCIDLMQLTNIRLEAYEDGKKVMSKTIDTDQLKLLTKRFKTNKRYSCRSHKTFNKLVELSGLAVNKRCGRKSRNQVV